jgi:hypothetical protein
MEVSHAIPQQVAPDGAGSARRRELAPGAFAAVKLRALHAIPDVGPVTVYVNGQQAVPSLGTLQETPYLEVPAGNYKVQVAPQGQPASAAVLSADVTLRDGKRYTAFASGQLARGTAALGLQEDRPRAEFGSSQIRVWHLSPDAPAVDVYVNGNKAVSNLAFRSATGYLTLPAGKYDVRINVANSSTVVLSQQITLARGEASTAVALGSAAQPAAGARFTVDALGSCPPRRLQHRRQDPHDHRRPRPRRHEVGRTRGAEGHGDRARGQERATHLAPLAERAAR